MAGCYNISHATQDWLWFNFWSQVLIVALFQWSAVQSDVWIYTEPSERGRFDRWLSQVSL